MKKQSILDTKPPMLLWSVFLLVTFLASILIVNPTLNPQRSIFSWPQLELQFAYIPEKGMEVLRSWDPGAIDRYFSVIWIDLFFAVSYGPCFYLWIRQLGGSKLAMLIPLIEMGTNLVETSLEMYWVANHSPSNPLFAMFLTHSIIATIKWILVPIYMVHTGMLFYRQLRSRAMGVVFRETSAPVRREMGPEGSGQGSSALAFNGEKQ